MWQSNSKTMRCTILNVFLIVLCTLNIVLFFYSSLSLTKDTSPREREPEREISKPKTDQVFDCINGMKLRDFRPAESDLTPFQFDSSGIGLKVVESPEHRSRQFVDTFKKKAWGTHDPQYKGVQASGAGSTLAAAQKMIAMLHLIVERIKKESGKDSVRILDAPCGDMAWMTKFLQIRPDVHYTGVDIVPDLIQIHHKTFKGMKNRDFFLHDIVKSPLNFTKEPFDLILSRHCLQHLTIKDTLRALRHFESTGSRYLLTTTWSYARENRPFTNNFETPGRFHQLNLEIPPYKLGPPICINLDGPYLSFAGLWRFPLKQLAKCHNGSLKVDRIFMDQKQAMVHC